MSAGAMMPGSLAATVATSDPDRMAETSNPELIVYCVYRRGGVGRFVEIEHVYEEAYQVAPSRFGWRTRNLPSDKAAAKAMQDASRGRRLPTGLLLFSPNSYGVQLTAEGVAWVKHRLENFEALVETRAPAGHERASQRYLVALERNDLARRYANGEDIQATRARFADLLRLTPDADARAWHERLETYRSAATHADRPVPLAFLARLEAEHPDWFEVTR